jgi:hypothetical protein
MRLNWQSRSDAFPAAFLIMYDIRGDELLSQYTHWNEKRNVVFIVNN